jgi:hypothetical protein
MAWLVVKVQLVGSPRFLIFYRVTNHLATFSITATAFTCAIAISALAMFFALQQQGIELDWSGNSLPFSGCDGSGCALHPVTQGSHFGPGEGEF